METINLGDFCQTIQSDLADLAGSNYPAMKREATGLLDAVVSPANRQGFSQEYPVDGGDGKLKQVLVEWIQPQPVSEMVTSAQDICTPTDPIDPLREIRTLTGFASTKVISFTKAHMRKLCDGPSEWRAKIVASHMSGLFRKINQGLVAKYNAQVGNFIGGVAAGKTVYMLDSSGPIKQIDPNGAVDIMEDMADLGVSDRPILVGAGILSRYASLANIGCCNAYGQDVSMADEGFDWYRDRDVDTILAGSNNVLAFVPGAVQMATYAQNRGEFGIVHEHFAESTIVDPVTGLEIDFEMRYDQCTKTYTMVFFSHYDLFLLPDDMFTDADERDGVNYAFRYTAAEYTGS